MNGRKHAKARALTLQQTQNDVNRLAIWGIVLTFAVMLALALFSRSAAADEAAARVAPAQMTVWAGELPHDFQAVTQRMGLKVVSIERLESLGSNIVYIVPAAGQSQDKTLQDLNGQFPTAQFERIDDGNTFQLLE